MPAIEEQEHKIKTLRKELSFAMRTANERYRQLRQLDAELAKLHTKLTEQEAKNLRLNSNLIGLLNVSCIMNLILLGMFIYISK